MMNPSRLLVATFLTIFGIATTQAQNLETLKGTCALAVTTHNDNLELRLERGDCPPRDDKSGDRSNRDSRRNCHTNESRA